MADLIHVASRDPLTRVQVSNVCSARDDFDELEGALARTFPSAPRLSYPQVVVDLFGWPRPTTLDCGLIRFPPAPDASPTMALRELAFESWVPELVAGIGLLPIADEGYDGGPLVVDLRTETDADRAPVCLWDHERRSPGPPLYPDAGVMIAAAAHLLAGGRVRDLATVGAAAAAEYYAWADEE